MLFRDNLCRVPKALERALPEDSYFSPIKSDSEMPECFSLLETFPPDLVRELKETASLQMVSEQCPRHLLGAAKRNQRGLGLGI